ncbi:MAG: hypothetical protein ACI9AQ_001693 [Dinoroseobacter sp.]|jgi:hypothetical protein
MMRFCGPPCPHSSVLTDASAAQGPKLLISKRNQTILQVGFMPAADDIVVQVKKLCDQSAAFPVVEQQDRICPASNTVVLTLATHEILKLDTVR